MYTNSNTGDIQNGCHCVSAFLRAKYELCILYGPMSPISVCVLYIYWLVTLLYMSTQVFLHDQVDNAPGV